MSGASGVLVPGAWQFSLSHRWQRSNRHFRGSNEEDQRQAEDSEVINNLNVFDFAFTYNWNERVSVTLDVPLMSAERSSPIRDANRAVVDRSETHAQGLSDMTLVARRWMYSAEQAQHRNLVLGLGETGGDVALVSQAPLNGRVGALAAGDADGDHADELLVVTYTAAPDGFAHLGYLERNPQDPRKGRVRYLDESLRPGSDYIRGVTMGDLDGDGRAEAVVGVGEWGKYDLRVYRFDPVGRTWALSWKLLLGFVTPVCADVDGDGRDEVLAGVSSIGELGNTAVFGPDNPGGADPGLYLYDRQDDRMVESYRDVIPPREGRQVTVHWLGTGNLDTNPSAEIGLTLDLAESGEPVRTMLFVYRRAPEGGWERWRTQLDGRVIGMGDVDADGLDEVVTLKDAVLTIYGWSGK